MTPGRATSVAAVLPGAALLVPRPAGDSSSELRVPRYGKPTRVLSTSFLDRGGIATEDAADFNGDGLVDILITKHNRDTTDTYQPLFLLNNGRGGFRDGT